ncbi:MAG: OsmC family protein [Burkholderiales bacterium]
MGNAIVNGVPVAALEGLVNAVKSDPKNGKTKWNAVTTWKGGFDCESKIRDHTVHMDEPNALGGTDTAPNMVENVLAAYGSCLTVGYALNAALRGINLKALKVEVEGDLDLAGFLGLSAEVPPGFAGVRAKVHLDSDAGPAAIQALHDHVLKTSPVGCILSKPLKVTTELA